MRISWIGGIGGFGCDGIGWISWIGGGIDNWPAEKRFANVEPGTWNLELLKAVSSGLTNPKTSDTMPTNRANLSTLFFYLPIVTLFTMSSDLRS